MGIGARADHHRLHIRVVENPTVILKGLGYAEGGGALLGCLQAEIGNCDELCPCDSVGQVLGMEPTDPAGSDYRDIYLFTHCCLLHSYLS